MEASESSFPGFRFLSHSRTKRSLCGRRGRWSDSPFINLGLPQRNEPPTYSSYVYAADAILAATHYPWEKREYPEETHVNTGRTCKLHTEMPTDPAKAQTSDLLVVR